MLDRGWRVAPLDTGLVAEGLEQSNAVFQQLVGTADATQSRGHDGVAIHGWLGHWVGCSIVQGCKWLGKVGGCRGIDKLDGRALQTQRLAHRLLVVLCVDLTDDTFNDLAGQCIAPVAESQLL